ncbi:MAG: UvrD-helicase domain-containing protein [Psychroserpens sp.]|nr:UvrD-helicase domain-containing protein [Psychroserpens sp.]
MRNTSSFTIYNASAGSGKTHTLVKEYLKVLFRSSSLLSFRSVLALTFTNKAVGEMKERVIESLKSFANPDILEQSNSMFDALCLELDMSPKTLHDRSKQLLQVLIHNYAAFDISTIDKFNHKIIRTFAHDLKLPVNFEVELDAISVLGRAVDHLIELAGSDEELTKILVNFAIEKTSEDKSWDVSVDLNKISKLLVQENDLKFLDALKDKSLEDFDKLRTKLQKEHALLSSQICALAKSTLELITKNQLEYSDFSGSYLPKYFIKLSKGDFNVEFGKAWQKNLLEGSPVYPKKTTEHISSLIERIRPQLSEAFEESQKAYYQLMFLKNVLNNIVPLSVLSSIKHVLEQLKTEDEFLLISEFNSIIQKEISQQPIPFIYERIGEKFKHYFIDEFQDTSKMQWDNLVPLIANTISGEQVSGETGSAMLVGDAKQAIYRWRGGYADQFIDLYSKRAKPFYTEQSIVKLPRNYRSSKTIVDFNNALFHHIAEMDQVFSNPDHSDIYKNAAQECAQSQSGYVELSFLDLNKEDDDYVFQCEAVHQKILTARNNNFDYKDICIIVRRKKEGVAISEFLKTQQIPILSSETLLLQNSPEVQFIINILTFITQPKNDEVKIEMLTYLGTFKLQVNDLHALFEEYISLSLFKCFQKLKDFGFDFDINAFFQLPIYEGIESIVRGFKLNKTANAYLQFFLDEVFDFAQKHNSNVSTFLDYWDRKKESLSIASPQGANAVQILTIHRSKGLEFPVVIFPFAYQDLYHDLNPKVWFPVNPEYFNGFNHLYLNFNKNLEHYSDTGRDLYYSYRSTQELDGINLLYVVLTRAVEQLYVISKYELDKTGKEKPNLYSGIFINYLKTNDLWMPDKLNYSFGNQERNRDQASVQTNINYQKELISTAKEIHNLHIITNSGYLWDTHQEEAIEKGNLVHDIMAKIESINDVDFALNSFFLEGIINENQVSEMKPLIENIVNHPKLKAYFQPDLQIFNERDIISKSGRTIRPDRLILSTSNDLIILDYKTGKTSAKHEEQLYDYQVILEEMDYKISKKILVYLNQEIVVKEF